MMVKSITNGSSSSSSSSKASSRIRRGRTANATNNNNDTPASTKKKRKIVYERRGDIDDSENAKAKDDLMKNNDSLQKSSSFSIPRKSKQQDTQETQDKRVDLKVSTEKETVSPKESKGNDSSSTPLFDSSSSDEDDEVDKVEAPWRENAKENNIVEKEESGEDNASLVAIYGVEVADKEAPQSTDIKNKRPTKKRVNKKVRVKVLYLSEDEKSKSSNESKVSKTSKPQTLVPKKKSKEGEKLTDVEVNSFVNQRNAEKDKEKARRVIRDEEELFGGSSSSSDDGEKEAPWRHRTATASTKTITSTIPKKIASNEEMQDKKKSTEIAKVQMKKIDKSSASTAIATITAKSATAEISTVMISKTKPEIFKKSIPKKTLLQSVPKKSLIPRKDPSTTKSSGIAISPSSENTLSSLIDHAMKPMSTTIVSSLYPSQNFKKEDKEETKPQTELQDTTREQKRLPSLPPRQQQQQKQTLDTVTEEKRIPSSLYSRPPVVSQQRQQKAMYGFDKNLEIILHNIKLDLDNATNNENPYLLSSKQKNSNAIDFNGSFLVTDDNKYDFYDVDEHNHIILQPKLPIFPEDFVPNQKNWPLSWWGIVEPPKEFIDEIMQIDNYSKNPPPSKDKLTVQQESKKESSHVDQKPHQSSTDKSISRTSNREYSDHKRHHQQQQHPHSQAWRNTAPNNAPNGPPSRRDFGMYRNQPPPQPRPGFPHDTSSRTNAPPPPFSRRRDRRP